MIRSLTLAHAGEPTHATAPHRDRSLPRAACFVPVQTPDQVAPTRPRTVTAAFVLYLVAVAGSLAQIVGMRIYLAWERALTERMLDLMGTPDYARPDPSGTTVQIVAQMAVSLVVTAAFWTMIAIFVRRGANWARVLATVFAAIGVVVGPVVLVLGSLLVAPPATYLVLSLPGWGALIVATILLWTRPARSWFAALRARRRTAALRPAAPSGRP
jgi:hypothetical protein